VRAISSAWARSARLAAAFAVVGDVAAAQQFFDDRVEPILSRRCLPCHNDELKDGGVSFMGRDGLIKGGVHGPTIRPGKPDASLLMQAIRREGELKMPPGPPLPAADVATLSDWIAQGAVWGAKLRAGELWKFDRLDQIGGHPAKILGHPRVIDTALGKAIGFNGKDDAIFVNVHPLSGADKFTWEVIFRPDPDGGAEQRFFHLQEEGTQNRLLFEIRITGGNWFLDSFAITGEHSRTLFNKEHVHPFGAWYHVAMVYDGKEFRNYVDGVQENAGELQLAPQGPGSSSMGVRINLRDYFKGAILVSRMTRRPLSPEEFLRK
jgi:Concanavalin A-like lectin/glucanases superfamily/Planctomycete cytochrome C